MAPNTHLREEAVEQVHDAHRLAFEQREHLDDHSAPFSQHMQGRDDLAVVQGGRYGFLLVWGVGAVDRAVCGHLKMQ
jgi:hypothetical protein